MYELIIKRKIGEITGLEEIKLNPPPPKFKGDLSTNASLVSGFSPRELAREMLKLDEVEDASVAGPGFVNMTISDSALENELKKMISKPFIYGSDKKKGEILLEMVSSNPTGPLHIGHGRGAAIGDSLARIYEKKGYDVLREYYVNDTGRQMELLGESVKCALQGREVPEGGYRGDYIKEIARRIKGEKNIPLAAGEKILQGHIDTLKKFNVNYSSFIYESSFIKEKKVEKIIQKIKEKGLAYENEGALWFRSQKFGDDADRVLIKKDGEYTYFASDCAYHAHKASRSSHIINIWGADHHGYVMRLKAFWKAFDFDPEKKMDIILYKLVNLLRGGEKISMSTRAGEFVTLEEVIDEVGTDASRFFMLMRNSDAPLDFDLQLAKEESSKNPVYYVQYSHARICSIFRKKGLSYSDFNPENPAGFKKEEKKVIKVLAHYPLLLEKCLQICAPHLISDYLREVSSVFHKYYDRVRVIGTENEEQKLALLKAVASVIKDGLGLIGVSAPEKM
ncbi:MAG: arginine--tRNA ligase [Elusimicrobiota bacterium]